MAAILEHTIGRWLRKLGADVSPRLLREKLQTHPDYPSLLSITDVLDELRIDNAALQIDKEQLSEVPLPFLAHDAAHMEFIVIDNLVKQVKPDFEKKWNGTVLLVKKPEGWHHPENEKVLIVVKQQQQMRLVVVGIIIVLAFLSLSVSFSFALAALLLTAMAGLAVAILIVQRELGIATPIGEKLCGADSNSGCDAVMHSRGSRLGKWLNWADAGIIYFTAYSLLLIIALYTGGTLSLLVLLSAAALPFTLFSLYYQWRVVKKWCRLCLLTVLALLLQAAIVLRFGEVLGELLQAVVLNDYLLTAFLFTAVSAVWLLLIKPLLQNNKNLLTEKFALLRFKNNPVVFEALLKEQRRVDTTPFEHELQLGNPDAPMQILVACNPYCGPCAQAHEALHELVNGSDIGLTIRFTVKTEDREDKKTQAVQYLLQLLHYSSTIQKRKALLDWFALMDYETFVTEWPLTGNTTDVALQLFQHTQWTKDAEIKFTPSVFINGMELPKQYQITDLKGVLRHLRLSVLSTETTFVENDYIPA